jgi:hypothetical protein
MKSINSTAPAHLITQPVAMLMFYFPILKSIHNDSGGNSHSFPSMGAICETCAYTTKMISKNN